MKKITKVVIAMMLAVSMLVACGGGGDSIVGKWESENGTIEFKNGGDMIFSEEEFGMSIDAKYEIKDGKLSIEMMGMTEEVEYELDGNKLIIEGEEFTRK